MLWAVLPELGGLGMSQGVTAVRFRGPMPGVEGVLEVRRLWSKRMGFRGSAGLEGHGTEASGLEAEEAEPRGWAAGAQDLRGEPAGKHKAAASAGGDSGVRRQGPQCLPWELVINANANSWTPS